MIIKCKMCGGDIQFNPGDTNGQCDHCGCTTTFPKLPDEQRANLFNRANHFRRQCEFDKAMAAYEHILEEDDTDAEAHWGIVLSKFGIEYVEDPVTHERIPTCHRAQVISILSDEDYQNALKYAPDTYSRDIYEKEAKRIAEIQKGILAISSQEKPYDVFICYKETDDNGSRTKDSTLAQEIYYQLTNEGYKVFFSRITLEDKLGQEFEPYIFAALNSAKVMLVVGTKPEYFNAVWVKNEWNRYLALMKNDRKRVLIPCYRDMDPYDLPEELSSLQSQDMGKIGFMQDIIHGVKKVLGTDKQSEATNVTVQAAGPGVTSLHKRALLFLEDSDWDSATEYFDRILDIDPEYAPAYIGKVQVKNKVCREADLARCREPISTDADFQKALRFADEKQKAIYNGYNRAITDRIELERKEAAYREALALEDRAAVEADFLAAARKFDSASDIRDAKNRAASCRAKGSMAKAEAEKAAAVYKEQMERERKERARQEEERRLAEEARQKAEAERQRKEEDLRREKRKQITKLCAVVAAVILVISGGYLLYDKVIQPKIKYNQAQALLDEGKLDEAYAAFSGMLDYSDSATKLLEINYKKAEAFLSDGNLTEAKRFYGLASGYSNSAQQISNIDAYIAAETDYNNNNLISAGKQYSALGDFLDSAAKFESVSSTLYAQATSALEAKDYEQAYSLLTILDDYSDSKSLMASVDAEYDTALSHWEAGEKLQAEQELENLVGWKDTEENLAALRMEIAEDAIASEDYDTALAYYKKVPSDETIESKIVAATKGKNYQEAIAALQSGNLETAYSKFAAAGGHKDADQQATKLVNYQQAIQLLTDKNFSDARIGFIELGDFLDSAAQLDLCNQTLYNDATNLLNQYKVAEAYAMFETISGYSDSAMIVEQIDGDYTAAIKLFEEKKYDEAISAFQKLYNYKDSEAKVVRSRYLKAENLLSNSMYEEAIAVYSMLGKYEDSQDKINLCKYRIAEQLYFNKEVDAAITAFEALAEYGDSQERANAIRYEKANALWQSGELQSAAEEFKALGDYGNAATDFVTVTAELADKSMASKDYAIALAAYQIMEQTDEIKEREYQLAQTCYDEGIYEISTKAYEELGQYQLSLSKLPISRYAWADQLFKNGDYELAAEQFALLGDMTDSIERANESTYQLANQLLNAGDFDKAQGYYKTIIEYRDSSTLAKECDYRKAKSLFDAEKYVEAQTLYESLESYEDSAIRATECVYKQAEALFATGKLEDARLLYTQIDYSDSNDKAKECAYLIAIAKMDAGQYADAENMLNNCNDYKDSANQIKECRYQQGTILYIDKQYEAALQFFFDLNYQDSAVLTGQCYFELGKIEQVNGNVEGAIAQYAFAVENDEASRALLAIAKDYIAINETEKAIQVLWLIRDKEEAQNMLAEIGHVRAQRNERDVALLALLSTGKNGNDELDKMLQTSQITSFEPLMETCILLPTDTDFSAFIWYNYAAGLRSVGRYDDSIYAYEKAGTYSDAMTEVLATYYDKGTAERENQEWDLAISSFASAGLYKDASDQVKETK